MNVEAVLAANSYWSPPRDEGSRWLYEKVFPPLRCFLQDHKSHQIVFGEQDDFAPLEDEFFDWMQLGFALMPTPRYLVEVLGLKSWDQVRVYMKERKLPAAWWEMTWCGDPSPHETGRQKFEDLLKEKYGGDR